jgi:hypothetical protein
MENRSAVGSPAMRLDTFTLSFWVSVDEEHVRLRLTSHCRDVECGARDRNFSLLTLARHRVADFGRGVRETSCGWVYVDDLCRDLAKSTNQLNLEVHRIRKHLASQGVSDARDIIQRREETRQIRIGSGRIAIEVV